MAIPTDAKAEPPAPPDFRRRLRFGWTQIVGVGLLSLLPVVALTGALDTTERTAEAHAGTLALVARYPASMHHGSNATLELSVRNDGSQPLRDVRLRFDDRYLSRFADLRFTPPPWRLDDTHAEVLLGEIAGGETRRVVLHLQADHYGRPQGSIVAQAEPSDEARVDVSTLVLP